MRRCLSIIPACWELRPEDWQELDINIDYISRCCFKTQRKNGVILKRKRWFTTEVLCSGSLGLSKALFHLCILTCKCWWNVFKWLFLLHRLHSIPTHSQEPGSHKQVLEALWRPSVGFLCSMPVIKVGKALTRKFFSMKRTLWKCLG